MKLRILFLFALLGSSPVRAAGGTAELKDAVLSDLGGKQVSFAKVAGGSGTVVLVAVATKCPVVRKYLPELNTLRKKWPGVRFLLVDPASYDSEAGLRKELARFSNRIPAYLDRSRVVARALGLNVTSKAVVLHDGALAYAGAIDDRYTFDGAKPSAQKHFLEDVLGALSEHRPVPDQGRATQAAGCAIALD